MEADTGQSRRPSFLWFWDLTFDPRVRCADGQSPGDRKRGNALEVDSYLHAERVGDAAEVGQAWEVAAALDAVDGRDVEVDARGELAHLHSDADARRFERSPEAPPERHRMGRGHGGV